MLEVSIWSFSFSLYQFSNEPSKFNFRNFIILSHEWDTEDYEGLILKTGLTEFAFGNWSFNLEFQS